MVVPTIDEIGVRAHVAMVREARNPIREINMRVRDAQIIAKAVRLIAERKGVGTNGDAR